MHIEYKVRPELTSDELNGLFSKVWEAYSPIDLSRVLAHSLTYIGAYREEELIGYVNVAWDGGEHAFLLDTAVALEFRRKGIGVKLVERAMEDVRARGIEWLHVDHEPHLEEFYTKCGFRHTAAGLIRLN